MGQDVSLLVAFGGGLAAFLSPCILPMIPTYLFFLAGEGARSAQAKDETGVGSWYRRGLIVKAALFVLGFTGVFMLFGVAVGAIGMLLFRWRRVIMYVAGATVVLFGLFVLAQALVERRGELLEKMPFLYRLFGSTQPTIGRSHRGTYLGALIMGVAFSLAWGPCAGPVAGAIAAYASVWGDVAKAVRLSIAFSAGLGIPFLLAAVFIDRLMGTMRKLGRLTLVIRVASGLLLVMLGVIVFTDSLWRIGIAFM